MITIGCDFGLSKSGVVLLDEDFGIISQNLITVDARGAPRLVGIEQAFDTILRPYHREPLNIFIEGYAFNARYQRESLAELGGVMRRYLYLAGHNYWVIPPKTLKKFVTDNGAAKKNYMKKCTKERWGHSFKSDDVCDAYGLARIGLCTVRAIQGIELDLPPYSQHSIDEIVGDQETYWCPNTATRGGRKKPNARKRTTKGQVHN